MEFLKSLLENPIYLFLFGGGGILAVVVVIVGLIKKAKAKTMKIGPLLLCQHHQFLLKSL
jgi:hypothetical protein